MRELEPGEADYWVSHDRFLTILDRIASHPARERISITFDDGNASDLLIAAPELRQRGLRAQFFVLTGRIGKEGSLTADDIRTLIALEMRIGSHGVGHRDWTRLTANELLYELESSKAQLEQICDRPVNAASMPFGWYNGAVLKQIRNAGYRAAYSSGGGSAKVEGFLKPRNSVRSETADSWLDDVLSGKIPFWRKLRNAARTKFRV
ncbi:MULTISPECIES: polysaccharide deacetylase family protein [Rhizobium]|uniref:Chitooligosaccharide deacetylase n=1 Tax=Rhizobium favelukesii TaxID=348824 RepID=W6RN04_9HYPH|nr:MULTISPECIES: polysaccharide deacetylase family protein [Rhizobium]MCA0804736.1 polysaccharide deacetylase family protein [Rhizobium sp. T1473]MCS0458011.1 polysaccharide deacetylase family protein [Rhizobium favelukesii]UFS79882.1 polysaccharide deacetylase family protein [Rhizobium sp. T136]CDM61595.1 polysaccharide deacetylase [Rhizobium favelukesii]